MSQQQQDQKSLSLSHHVSGGGVILKPSSRGRSWTLTVNNWTENHMSQLSRLSTKSKHWIIGKEIGDSGTPHLQAYFQFKNQTRFSTLKKAVPTGHWEKAKGSVQDNYVYCSKDGDFDSNIVPKVSRQDLIDLVLNSYENVIWKPWQQSVLDMLAVNPDSRTINWIYEPTGNVGKSFLAKYLACKPGTIISSGKAADVFNQLNTAIEKGARPTLVILDVPRVIADFVSYQALEKLKDGCLYSGKYEGGTCIFPDLHVVAFANQKPTIEKMSKDRWKIFEIKNNTLFQKII